MKYIITAFLLLFVSINAAATIQIPDKLIFEGREYELRDTPLEDFFEKNPDKRPEGGLIPSSLWRGYIATFEIREGQLYVKDIQIKVRSNPKDVNSEVKQISVMAKVFPTAESAKLTWYSGLLELTYGKFLKIEDGKAMYENYMLIEINYGEFVKAKKLTNDEYPSFLTRQYEAFKKTKRYEFLKDEFCEKYQNCGNDSIEELVRSQIIKYSGKLLTD